MNLVPKLVVLILICSTFHFEGAYSKKQHICKKLKGKIGEVLTVMCKKAGKKAKWVKDTPTAIPCTTIPYTTPTPIPCTGYYWEQIVLSRRNLIYTFPYIGKEYKVAFDLEITSYGPVDSVIHFTTGGDGGGYGERTPAVWVVKEDYFYISSAINGNGNYVKNVPIDLQDNKYHIEISQSLYNNKYWYNIAIDHVSVFTIENTDAQKFDKVEMWAGDPWYAALGGILTNVCVNI